MEGLAPKRIRLQGTCDLVAALHNGDHRSRCRMNSLMNPRASSAFSLTDTLQPRSRTLLIRALPDFVRRDHNSFSGRVKSISKVWKGLRRNAYGSRALATWSPFCITVTTDLGAE